MTPTHAQDCPGCRAHPKSGAFIHALTDAIESAIVSCGETSVQSGYRPVLHDVVQCLLLNTCRYIDCLSKDDHRIHEYQKAIAFLKESHEQ